MRKRKSKQLIALVHGPGGCGKSTVIDLLIEYIHEFCNNFENFPFHSRMIVVTAMTGVAATHICGETTHSAAFRNQKRPIDAKQIELWSETRFLIIDEISFAGKLLFEELDRKLRKLRARPDAKYGGVHIVFAGDF